MNYEDMTLQELKSAAKELGIKGITGMKKSELVQLLNAVKGHQKAGKEAVKMATAEKVEKRSVVEKTQKQPTVTKAEKQSPEEKTAAKKDSVDFSLDSGKEANGILEVMADGFGFIRCENYLPGDHDIYVSPAQIKKFNLKTGDIIVGNQKVKTDKEKFAALLYIRSINGYTIEETQRRKNFEDLTPIFPNERIQLENAHSNSISMRIMDLLAPIGKGQRGMIVAPPKAGKTTLLKQDRKSVV